MVSRGYVSELCSIYVIVTSLGIT